MARKCKVCSTQLPKHKDSTDIFHKKRFCGIACLSEHGKAKAQEARERKARAKHKADKERVKTKAEHAREAQQAFNAWVRARDADQPCISCGRHHQGQYHAGHYRSVGSNPALRFEPLNVHKQCAPCNNHLSGNAIEYRIGLVKRIGQDAVDWLEGPHDPKRYTVDDLKAIKAEYRAKLRGVNKQ